MVAEATALFDNRINQLRRYSGNVLHVFAVLAHQHLALDLAAHFDAICSQFRALEDHGGSHFKFVFHNWRRSFLAG